MNDKKDYKGCSLHNLLWNEALIIIGQQFDEV